MRIISMILIVIHHVVGQGLGFQFFCLGGENANITNWNFIICIESFCIIGVNVFLLISGFYGIRLKSRGILKYLLVLLAFIIFHSLLEYLYNDGTSIKHTCGTILTFLSGNSAWFAKCYFMLMISSMLINPALEKMNNKNILFLLLVVIYVNVYLGYIRHWAINENGYTLSHMIMMYLIGHCLNRFNLYKRFKAGTFLCTYCMMSCTLAMIMIFLLGRIGGEAEFHLLGYNNPIIMLSSISFFCMFAQKEYVCNTVNYIAAGTFGIYLFHQYARFWHLFVVPNIRSHFEELELAQFLLYAFILILAIVIAGVTLNIFFNSIIKKILRTKKVSSVCEKVDSYAVI